MKRILAGLRCKAAKAILYAKCAIAVASLLYLPLKLLKIVEVAKGAEILSKVPKKFYPVAKLFYDITHDKVLSKAPPGFRSVSEIRAKFKDAKTILTVIKNIPDLVRALSRKDVSEIALDLANILGLHSCVQAVANAGGA